MPADPPPGTAMGWRPHPGWRNFLPDGTVVPHTLGRLLGAPSRISLVISESPRADGPAFSLESRHEKDTAVIEVRGALDMTTAPRLGAVLPPLLAVPPARLLMDLSQISFVSSAGLAQLVNVWQQCREVDTAFLLLQPNQIVQRVLEISGFDRVFRVIPATSPPHDPQSRKQPDVRHPDSVGTDP